MKYVIYARVSTSYESQDSSFEVQTKELKKKIKVLYPSWSYIDTYGDQGISGKKESRPQFQQMLKDARQHKFDCVVTKSISRFARNTRVLLQTLEEFDKLGIKVLFLEENIDSQSASQKFLLTVLGGLAEMESQNTSAHIRESNSIKRSAGQAARKCAVPFGYIWQKETKTILVDKDAAVLVNKIFTWFVEDHYSQGKIAALATNAGMTARHGANHIDRATIEKILSNKKYIGIAEEKDSSTGKIYEFKDVFPPIIDFTLFKQAQDEKLKRKKSPRGKTEAKLYPLSNLCFCTICNKKATRFTDLTSHKIDGDLCESSKGRAFWGCRSLAKNKDIHSCKTFKMSEQYIYEAIIEALVTAACGSKIGVEENLMQNSAFNQFLTSIEEADKNYNIELLAFEKRQKELEKAKKKELDLFRADLIDEAELKTNIKKLDKEIASLTPPKSPDVKKMNKDHLKAFLTALKTSSKDWFNATVECRKHLYELFKDADFRRSIVNVFVDKVWIGGEKYTITVELKNPLVSYSHRFKHRAPVRRNGVFYTEDFD